MYAYIRMQILQIIEVYVAVYYKNFNDNHSPCKSQVINLTIHFISKSQQQYEGIQTFH